MGIADLFEIGFFTAFWNWSNGILTLAVYACLGIGVVLQMLLQKKCRSIAMTWTLIALCLGGALVSEILWHAITGWDRLAVDILYGAIVCILIGACLTKAFFFVKGIRSSRAE